jgi:hypothetical protein
MFAGLIEAAVARQDEAVAIDRAATSASTA